MRRHAVCFMLACAVGCAVPRLVSAQTPGDDPKGYVGVSIGALVTRSTVSAPLAFPVYGESARLDWEASWPAGPTLEIDGGVRLWHHLGVAVTVTRGRRDGESTVAGPVPHPYFFNQPRTFEATGGSLTRTETAAHIGLMWRHRVTRRTTVAAMIGPSLMAVGQDVIAGVVLSETYPYTVVDLSQTTIARRDRSATGIHAAGEVVFALAAHLGVTGGARYSHATVTVESATGQPFEMDLGGVVVRGGLRWLF